jgi:uncharacterized membrane protein YgcG
MSTSTNNSTINSIYNKLSSLLQKSSTDDENEIDIAKTFSTDNIDIIPIIKNILELNADFPYNVINSKAGHKYTELEFFQSNQDSNVTNNNNANTNPNSLFEKLNRTHTQLGKLLLQSIILEPSGGSGIDITLIKKRQQLCMKFMTHPELEAIRNKLINCSKIEKDILSLQNVDTPEMEEVYKTVFFQFLPLQQLNYNDTFLKLFYYFIIIFSPVYGAVAPFIFMFAPYLFMRYMFKLPITFGVFWGITKNMILGGTGFFSNLNKILNSGLGKVAEAMVGGGSGSGSSGEGANGGGSSGGGISIKSVVLSLVKWFVAFMSSSTGTYIYLGFLVVTYLYGIYNSFQVSITYNKIINMFHSRLNIISKWLKNVMSLYNMQLCFEHPETKPIIEQIKKLLSNSTIISLLNHSTFNEETNLLSNKGIIIKTFKEFLDIKKILEPFCKYIAHVDVWSSLGKWLYEGKNSNNDRSICTFIENSQVPLVNGTDVWNICCNSPIYNNVRLGGEVGGGGMDGGGGSVGGGGVDGGGDVDGVDKSHSNMLITGPNGSGKSTYIKSVIECILLGQTLGIAPAKEFSFTPFTNIATYLNIPDCQGKESLFQAEMNRCYQQLQTLNDAEEKGQFSFNIMDEIFVSTNYQEGMSGAYAIIKKMCKMNKCLNIITTHFDVLAGMDEVCVSKKYFDIEIDDNDNIKCDYKIRDGVSKKHMALKLLKKKGFDPSIIADAEYLYSFLEKSRAKNHEKIGGEVEEVDEVEKVEKVEKGEVDEVDEIDEVEKVEKIEKVEKVDEVIVGVVVEE